MTALPDLYEICENKACGRCTDGTEFAVGISLCPDCGSDTKAMDRRHPLTRILSTIPGVNQLIPAPSNQTPVQQLVTVATLRVRIRGVVPTMFPDSEVQEFVFVFDGNGGAPGKGPMYGDVIDGKVSIGVLQPNMTWRPSLDLAAYSAFSPNISADGSRIPVAGSKHMASIFWDGAKLVLLSEKAENRPRPVDFTNGASVGHRMDVGQQVALSDGDVYVMGDFVLQFSFS